MAWFRILWECSFQFFNFPIFRFFDFSIFQFSNSLNFPPVSTVLNVLMFIFLCVVTAMLAGESANCMNWVECARVEVTLSGHGTQTTTKSSIE
mgnify:CR=1 FL=1